MPRKPDDNQKLDKRWNFFVNENEKLEFLLALAKNGKQQCQSAALRAFMYLYANDDEVKNKIHNIIKDFIVYKRNGKISVL